MTRTPNIFPIEDFDIQILNLFARIGFKFFDYTSNKKIDAYTYDNYILEISETEFGFLRFALFTINIGQQKSSQIFDMIGDIMPQQKTILHLIEFTFKKEMRDIKINSIVGNG